jgi:putative hemolysin
VRALPYSRFPVIDDGFDDIVGFVHVRDLLDADREDARTVGDVRRDVLLMPSTVTVLPAVSTLRHSGTHLAVVVDEHGGTDGIVTLEDLVEELVGEIRDEYDAPDAGEPLTAESSTYDAGLTIEHFSEQTESSWRTGRTRRWRATSWRAWRASQRLVIASR